VFRPHAARKRDLADAPLRFALYVEGPRDRDVLRHFAQKLSPELAKTMDPCVRILGGKQPERAAQMFGRLVEEAGETNRDKPRGLCILDRDDDESWNAKKSDDAQDATSNDAANLEFVVWNRRQIESYLLVPQALRRCASKHGADPQFDRILASTLPENGDEAAFADYLGRPLRAREIVRNMSPVDIHDDVKAVLTRVRDYVGTRRNPVSTLVGQPT
jgi:hypothetical protein